MATLTEGTVAKGTVVEAMPVTAVQKPARLVSMDAYRGFVMLAMASSAFGIGEIAANADVRAMFQGRWYDGAWRTLMMGLHHELRHVDWTGCAFWDLIQPSFMFMVGVAIPYSHARRVSLGESPGKIYSHVLIRSLVLILLGIFLRSGGGYTNFTFEDVLTQIGLGYAFVYLLRGTPLVVQVLALIAILVGDWYLFFQHPLPPPDFDYSKVGGGPIFTGYAGHWNRNTNFAWWFDAKAFGVGFMNLFPRPKPFEFNGGGYSTLNFIPSMATMIFGLITGEMLRRDLPLTVKFKRMAIAGLIMLAVGMSLDGYIWPFVNWTWTICPIVKKIWTPSWAIFSTGWTLLLLAGFFWLIDVKGYRAWAFPFIVVGMNSIAMYVMSYTMKGATWNAIKTHFGILKPVIDRGITGAFGQKGLEAFNQGGPVFERMLVLFALWLICLWMYRQKIFVKV